MKKIAFIAVVMIAAGCQTPVKEARVDAQKRWYGAQAKIHYALATEHLRVGQLDKACRKATEALSLAEDFTPARILLGKVYIEQGNYTLAIDELTRAREAVGDSFEICYLLGVAMEKDNRLEEALASYKLAQALNTRSVDAAVAAGEVLVSLDRGKEARAFVESYATDNHDEPALFELAGRLASMENDYAAAADHFQQAHDLDMRNVRYCESLARSQFLARRYTDAIDTLRDLTLMADYSAPLWVYTFLGDCYVNAGRLSDAREAYRQATEIDPDDGRAWVNLAKAAMLQSDYARAIISCRHAMELNPRDLLAAMTLGHALLKDGQADVALEVLISAAQIHPSDATLGCLLGRAYAASGNDELAEQCYRRVLANEPGNRLAQELLASR